MHRTPRGLTLVEVMIATALAMICIGAFLQLMASQNKIAAEEVQETASQNSLTTVLTVMLPLLQEGKPDATYDSLPSTVLNPISTFKFSVPMKDAEGRTLWAYNSTKNANLFRYGAGVPGFMTEGGSYELFFRPNFDVATSTGRADDFINEATLVSSEGIAGIDLNNDGDKVDRFVFGSVGFRELRADGSIVQEQLLSGRVCLPTPGGVLFELMGTRMDISLSYLDIREDKPEMSRLRTTRTSVKFRN